MNLAIEYLLRNKRIHSMLTLPTSLFLTTEKDQKLIVTLNNSYGCRDVLVKHWKLWETTAEHRLPPFNEYRVSRAELFDSPNVILKECRIMNYEEDPYPCGGKQHTDISLGNSQEQEYHLCLDNFYNSELHRQARLSWLWHAFESIYVTEELKFQYEGKYCTSAGMQLQRDSVQFYSKPVWYTWLYWRKHLLDFTGVAAELIFRRDYMKEEPADSIWTGLYSSTASTPTTNVYYTWYGTN